MKANELMVGDWVNLLGKPHRITLRDMECMCFNEENHLERIEYEPIPITSTDLGLNGFDLRWDESGWSHRENWLHCTWEYHDEEGSPVTIEVVVDVYKGTIPSFSVNSKYRSIEGEAIYMHELQQAIRFCRIKKEIELL